MKSIFNYFEYYCLTYITINNLILLRLMLRRSSVEELVSLYSDNLINYYNEL